MERREALRTDRKVRAAPRKRGLYSSRLSALRSLSFFGGENETKLERECVARTQLLCARDLTLSNATASIRRQEEAPESMGEKRDQESARRLQ